MSEGILVLTPSDCMYTCT